MFVRSGHECVEVGHADGKVRGNGGGACIARRREQLRVPGALLEFPEDGVLSRAAPDDQYLHSLFLDCRSMTTAMARQTMPTPIEIRTVGTFPIARDTHGQTADDERDAEAPNTVLTARLRLTMPIAPTPTRWCRVACS